MKNFCEEASAKFTDVCMTGGMEFSTHIFSADISPEMLKHGRVTKVKVLFLVMVFVFHFDLFKFSAAILEKGLLCRYRKYLL